MNIVVVEDEASIARRLMRLISEVLKIKEKSIIHFDTLEDSISYIEQSPPDLLFLDLNLSGEDGFDVLKEVSIKNFDTIIVSANTNRALEAFEYGVLDFVPKPFKKERIAKALDRYNAILIDNVTQAKKIPVKKQGSIQLIPIDDILYLKGANNYSEIHLKNGKRALSEKSLDSLIKILPHNFKRIHRSYILNMDEIQKLIKSPGSKYELELLNGSLIPLGRTYYKSISREYFNP
jgi:DNA-binding LytR/AlgR family response regulator